MSEQTVDLPVSGPAWQSADRPTAELTEVSPEVVQRLEELGYIDAGLDI